MGKLKLFSHVARHLEGKLTTRESTKSAQIYRDSHLWDKVMLDYSFKRKVKKMMLQPFL